MWCSDPKLTPKTKNCCHIFISAPVAEAFKCGQEHCDGGTEFVNKSYNWPTHDCQLIVFRGGQCGYHCWAMLSRGSQSWVLTAATIKQQLDCSIPKSIKHFKKWMFPSASDKMGSTSPAESDRPSSSHSVGHVKMMDKSRIPTILTVTYLQQNLLELDY
jgi:hypothetical protein